MRRTALGLAVDFADLSDPGRDPSKQVNEDSCGFSETPLGLLSVVCDGMGGHAGGRQASQTAVRVILERCQAAAAGADPTAVLGSAIAAAGREVFELGRYALDAARPGATCVAALLTPRGATVAHVGDSRAMLIRADALSRLTRDHSMVRQMVDAGLLTEAEAGTHPDANKITRALGMTPDVEVEVQPETVPLSPDDVLVLTSDGVTDLVTDPDLLGVVGDQLPRGPAAVCHRIVQLGNARGGHDNLTVQVLHVLEVPNPPPAAAVRSGSRRGDTVLLDDTAPGAPRTERVPTAPNEARGPQPTLPDHHQPKPTVVDPGRAAAGSTLVPELRDGRQTEPAPPPTTVRQAAGLAAPSAAQPSSTLPALVRRRLTIALVALGLFVALGLLLAWWGRQSRSRHTETEPPPPAAQPAPLPTPQDRPDVAVELVPDEPPVLPEAGAAPPDAAIDAAPTAPAPENSSAFP